MKNKLNLFFSTRGITLVEAMTGLAIIGILLALLFAIVAPVITGAGSFGPTNHKSVTVTRLYVDHSGSGDSAASHYMVGTDNGVYEVANGLLLGIWNADELYSRLREGGKYRITTEGNKVVGFWMQEYPYITAVQEITDSPVETK
jgi:hypothetical protein